MADSTLQAVNVDFRFAATRRGVRNFGSLSLTGRGEIHEAPDGFGQRPKDEPTFRSSGKPMTRPLMYARPVSRPRKCVAAQRVVELPIIESPGSTREPSKFPN